MKTRTVSTLLYGQTVDMGGFPVRQAFPTNNVENIDPFLLLHHANIKVPTHVEPRHAGVGPHPHRGFSPVTFVFQGGVHHRDSRGNDSVIYEGGAQWMNAGRGVIHSERPPHDILERGGRQEIIQLWINTPAKHKMDEPFYFPVSAENAVRKTYDESKVTLTVFAGELDGLKGPIPSHTEVNAATSELKKGGRLSVNFHQDHNAFIYLLDGKLKVEGFGLVEAHHAVVFNQDGDGIVIEALEDTRILLMTGAPLKEQVVSHGPFVMNTTTEILEAMRDYQVGKMGVLIEE
ncbi:pirin family protein [Pseudochryseolinea flava]|uniref:Pirin family protein n=1 Tax=Pseudochryseolinea flava TaxID=2059302 RepID=A0A364XZ04_9BACT|nr:pirin family protein [Pseudochryseolinea flava]RAV99713.1 pirin family protein [Pseudochryseolinea flava]